MARIHVVLSTADKARYGARARREGKSLGGWLREAADEKLHRAAESGRFETSSALAGFFDDCDARELRSEPDWHEHRSLIERSRIEGLERT